MREILFRAKRIAVRDWVEGFYVHVPKGRWDNEEHLIQPIKEDGRVGTLRNIDPETVGQFTGLTDKNGKKIFEGDIVKSEFTQKPYKVCFGEYTYTDEYGDEESACGWYNEEEGGYVTAFACPDAWATVIGNIHDNPELLEGK